MEEDEGEYTGELSSFGRSLFKQSEKVAATASGLPKEFGPLLEYISEELAEKTDEELQSFCGGLSSQDRRVKILFWDEYERALTECRSMALSSVAMSAGLPSWESYMSRLEGSQPLLVWFMRPPVGYQVQVREAHSLGMERLREILSLPIKTLDKHGNEKVNVPLAKLLLSAYQLLDQRMHGAATQRIVNVSVSDKGVEDTVPTARLTYDAVEARIRELEMELGNGDDETEYKPPGNEPEEGLGGDQG